MYLYWDSFILPLLATLRPHRLLEIGCAAGRTTRLLLDFCRQTDARLHAVEPAPQFDAPAWRDEYGEIFTFHQARSLDVLAQLPPFDGVLCDGDHNYYTVFHELQALEQTAEEAGRLFPAVLLHDVDWPYARRDLYYAPEDIPHEYRHPYEQRGIRPDSYFLAPNGGFNPTLHHATGQQTPANGVRTAIEDFMDASIFALNFWRLPGFHGLGLLYPAELLQRNSAFAALMDLWTLPAPVEAYIERLEAMRVGLAIRLSDERLLARHREAELQESLARASHSDPSVTRDQQ